MTNGWGNNIGRGTTTTASMLTIDWRMTKGWNKNYGRGMNAGWFKNKGRGMATGWAWTAGWAWTTGWAWTVGWALIRAGPFGEVGIDDVGGREDGVNIDRRRPDHEGESGLERRGFGKARPFDGIAHVAVSRNGDDLAGLVVQEAFALLITDLDGTFDEQQQG